MLAITAPVSPGCVPFEALFPSAAKEKKGNGTRKRRVLERGGTERTRGKKKKKPGIWIQSWDIKAGRVQHPRAGARRAWVLRIAIQIARRGWGHLRASSVPPKTDRREKRSSSNRKSHSRNGRPFLYRFYDCLQRYVVIFRRNIWKNRTSLAYISFQFSIIVTAFSTTRSRFDPNRVYYTFRGENDT